MKAFIIVSIMALATTAGITASQASPSNDACVSQTFSLHGVWDCR